MNRRTFLKVASAGLLAGGCASVGSRRERRIRIAHIGDPQFGFSREDPGMRGRTHEECYVRDLAVTERIIESVNASSPDLVVIAGDMTDRPEDVTRDWPRLVKRFTAPVMVAPGNHDMGNRPARANYERFLSVFGCDHCVRELGGFALVVANSQFSRETDGLDRERREHDEWFFKALKTARGKGLEPIVATHIGPFVHTRGEKDGYENLPKNGLRERVLEACAEAGVRFWLAGHTHAAYLHMAGELTVLNAQSLAYNFDRSPAGWHLFELDESGDWSWNLRRV